MSFSDSRSHLVLFVYVPAHIWLKGSAISSSNCLSCEQLEAIHKEVYQLSDKLTRSRKAN